MKNGNLKINCDNCGERMNCHHFLNKDTPIKCNCYWNSETESFAKLEELMKNNRDVLQRLKER